MSKIKPIPTFQNEDEEREFWATHDTTEYFDFSQAKRVRFPHLKPSTQTISLRLTQSMLSDLKILANQQDVPYQSLMKVFLAERIRLEMRDRGRREYSHQNGSDQEKSSAE